jgi:hypothetical protein
VVFRHACKLGLEGPPLAKTITWRRLRAAHPGLPDRSSSTPALDRSRAASGQECFRRLKR